MNPKAETVEELQGRRKKLHLGIKERVLRDFDDQTREHESRADDAFNRDEEYRVLSNEAIDGKAYALEKMDTYLKSTADGGCMGQPETILGAALKDFASRGAVMGMRTGITVFPWADVLENNKPEIDLGEWDAGPIPPQALELIRGALGGSTVIRAVRIKGASLALSEGWATVTLNWSNTAAAWEAPATASMVLWNCVGLKSLDLRCVNSKEVIYTDESVSESGL